MTTYSFEKTEITNSFIFTNLVWLKQFNFELNIIPRLLMLYKSSKFELKIKKLKWIEFLI